MEIISDELKEINKDCTVALLIGRNAGMVLKQSGTASVFRIRGVFVQDSSRSPFTHHEVKKPFLGA